MKAETGGMNVIVVVVVVVVNAIIIVECSEMLS
jgi:hypothetical protein